MTPEQQRLLQPPAPLAPAPTDPVAPQGILAVPPAPVMPPSPLTSQLPATPGQTVQRDVNAPQETVQGRMQGLLATDQQGNYTSPFVQQASETAQKQFAGRGLLNSSMAVQGASQAAMSKAQEIASPDAQTFFSQGRANQDALNVFARDKIGNDFTASQQDKELAQRGDQFDREFGLKGQEVAQRASQFDRELAYKFEAMKFDTDSRTQAAELAQKNSLEINNIKSVNDQYDLYLRRISEIDNNTAFDAATKMRMKNSAGSEFDVFARSSRIVWETMGGRFGSAAAPAAAPASSSTWEVDMNKARMMNPRASDAVLERIVALHPGMPGFRRPRTSGGGGGRSRSS